MPALADFTNDVALGQLIETARREDLGPAGIDATSQLFIDAAATCTATLASRQAGVVAGLAVLPRVIKAYDPTVSLSLRAEDGAGVEAGAGLAELRGPLRSVLMLERVALNLVGHLSGVATQTSAFAQRIAHTSAKVYDTRKTLPGLRGLQKYAVACGGGGTHRLGLYDAVLVKDNHLAHRPIAEWTEALREMSGRARREIAGLKFVMVEVDTLAQLDAVLAVGPAEASQGSAPTVKTPADHQPSGSTGGHIDLVLLDNMDLDTLREAVRRRDAAAANSRAGRVELEASGGVTLDTVKEIAETGVDRVSIGALTHSVNNLDVGLDVSA